MREVQNIHQQRLIIRELQSREDFRGDLFLFEKKLGSGEKVEDVARAIFNDSILKFDFYDSIEFNSDLNTLGVADTPSFTDVEGVVKSKYDCIHYNGKRVDYLITTCKDDIIVSSFVKYGLPDSFVYRNID